MCSNANAKTMFNSNSFEVRTLEQHKTQCDLEQGPLGDHYSTTYGINRRSILLEIPHFSMCGFGLPHDIMHDMLEGVIKYELKRLLTLFCE